MGPQDVTTAQLQAQIGKLERRIIGLCSSRHGQWKREAEQGCPLDDLSQCPRMHPGQRTPDEVGQRRHMATAPEYFSRRIPERAVDLPDQLAAARTKAREARLAANRLRECHDCPVSHQAA